MSHRTVLTIGTFDGVHHGHAALVERAAAIARDQGGLEVVALVFDPHPMTTLNPAMVPARLSTFAQRERWLKAAGATRVDRLAPDAATLGLDAEAFIRLKIDRYAPAAFVEGPDFRFGKARRGDVLMLDDLGRKMGFGLEVVLPVSVALSDHRIVPARSTVTRELIREGRVRDAAMVLGRPYELEGEVVPGDRRGRTIGFPTANIKTDQLLPADGVYAALAVLPDGRELPAAINIGERPTFAAAARTTEAHIILSGAGATPAPAALWSPLPGVPEYHWPIRLKLVAWLRDQARFESLDLLKAQLARDCRRAVEFAAAADELAEPIAPVPEESPA